MGVCPDKSGIHMPLINAFQSLLFQLRNMTNSICAVVLVMPSFQVPSQLWLNFSNHRYAISTSISSEPGCGDRVSFRSFLHFTRSGSQHFSEFRDFTCERWNCLNPAHVPNQVILHKSRFVDLKPDSIMSVSIKWLYAASSTDVVLLLDQQITTSFTVTFKSDNITNILISVPSFWSPGVHTVVIYSNLIGTHRNSSFVIEGRISRSPNVTFCSAKRHSIL